MTRALLRLRFSVLAVMALAACTAPGGGTAGGDGLSERVFVTIEYYGDPFRATVPATAEVGTPFEVTVVTYGGSCLERGETTVRTEGSRAEIRPYEYDTDACQRSLS